MAKVVEGIAAIAGGLALAILAPEFSAVGDFLFEVGISAIGIGASLSIAGIAQLLQAGPSSPFSIRQSAAPRVCVYGQSRVAGTIVYISTTNSGKNLNQVIVWAAHSCQSVQNIYLDGRLVHLSGTQGDGATYYDDSNNAYHFGPTDVEAVFHTLGTVPGTQFSSLSSADPYWVSSMTLDGLCATYIRNGYDANSFVGAPGVKATIYGKNDIYDPRSGTRGFTTNAALIVADFLCNDEWGLGCIYANEIDESQLIAAANICDEQIPLAAGGTESQYTINGSFSTTSTPGEILDALLQSMEGRISYTGGVWKIYPATWYGSTLSFTNADLTDKPQWLPSRKVRDLINAVRATYICPRYPYARIGYDRDNKDTNIFTGEWQPCDAPEYAQDPLHGYSGDANLARDGNFKLYATRSYKYTTSAATAQRLAKIYLLRNRFQGSGTFKMNLRAYQLEACDIFQMTSPMMGMTNQYLEVTQCRLILNTDDGGKESPTLTTEIQVAQVDPSIYYWSTVEERTADNSDSPSFLDPRSVQSPTGLTLTSGQAQAVIGIDGIILPRIQISWVSPPDPFVSSGGYIEVQYQIAGSTNWISLGKFDPSVNTTYLVGIVQGSEYNVQIRAARGNGATSPWIEAGPEVATSSGSLVAYAWGTNAVANPGFETNVLNNALGADNWRISEDNPSNVFAIAIERNVSTQRSGVCNLLIRLLPNAGTLATGGQWSARVWSSQFPVSGSAAYYWSGWLKWDSTAAIPAGLTILARIGVYIFDQTGTTLLSEQGYDTVNLQNGNYTFISKPIYAPPGSVYMLIECCQFVINNSGSSITIPNALIADLRFDDLFITQQTGSGLFQQQGSVVPALGIIIPSTFTNSGATLSWSAQNVASAYGQTLTTNSGSQTYSGLLPSTEYYTYWRIRTADGGVESVSGTTPPTSPIAAMALLCNLDGYIPIGLVTFITLSASNPGTGSSGGGDICPISHELVTVRGRGEIPAGDVVFGDEILGYSFISNRDVYRRVIHTREQESAAWRLVDGHLVSPGEPIYWAGKWQPAYLVPSDLDTTIGLKALITVEADSDGEHNYWLTGGNRLLIHNTRVYGC